MTFTNPKEWWKYKKEDIMRDAYWQHDQLPPTDTLVYEQEWQNIKQQLTSKYGDGQNQNDKK